MSFVWKRQEELIWDWDLNPREKDESHVRAIASHMNEHGYDPKYPIIVYKFEGAEEIYYAATGHHRLEASLLKDDEFPNLPLSEVFVEIIEGTHSEYVRRMLIDNFQHTPGFNKNVGKIPTRKELQQMRFQLLFFPDVFEKGDRLLATGWGCDHKTVSEVRNWFISKLTRGETLQPDYVPDSDIEKIKEIIASDLYLGKDGKKYPRTTKPVEPKLFGAPDPMEKYLELQETLDRVIDSSLFGAINDNPVGKHNIARMLKRAGCYAKGFSQAFLWDNRTDLSAEHVSHLEKANVILQEIVIDVEIFTLNHEQNREKCKVYLNELYTKLTEKSDESKPVEEVSAEESDTDDYQIDLLIKDIWSELSLWIARNKGKRIDYAQPFMLVEAARREMQDIWDRDDKTPGCSTELKGDATLEELNYVLESIKEDNNRFIDAVQFVMFGDASEPEDAKSNGEPQPEPIEETPAYIDVMEVVEEASETNILKIRGMTIYIDNPDSSKSFGTAVHFSEKKSEDIKDHLISDIPSDVLAELERVVNKKLQ